MRFFPLRASGTRMGRSKPVDKRRGPRTRRVLALESLESRALLSGTFTALTHTSPAGLGTMMLESDGSVIAQGGGISKTWYHLTPDSSGSYVNGTWTQLASMSLQRLYFGSNVLPDGRIFVQGGEYSGPYGLLNLTNSGEVYSPLTNSWSKVATFPQGSYGDDPSEVLPNGNVLTGYVFGAQTYLYNPTSNTWSTGGTKLRGDQSDEEAWVKLPDNSILSYDIFSSNSSGVGHAQRYVPSTNTWVDAGTLPVLLSSTAVGDELGPGFLLPDGRVFDLGANGNTAYYTESTNSWTAGPVIPGGLGADDAPGAELPDGKILFTADTPLFKGPAHIFEFDPTAGANGTYTDLTPGSGLPSGYLNGASFVDRMVVLPSGQVLFNSSSSQLYVYTPDLPPVPSGTPTISGIAENADGSFTLSGTGLNGSSEGAGYGDDVEMSSNYPIINLTDPSGNVFYARTYNWSSTGVSTGSTPETTSFALPVGVPANTYSLRVIANGSPSAPFSFTIPTDATDPAPTIAVAASATPNPDPGTSASLSALGADTLGESTLAYTWAATSVPSGAAYPSFSANGTNAAKNDTVTFSRAGSYTFLVTATNLAGLSVNSTVTMIVNQTFTSIAVSTSPTNVNPNATRQFYATGLDQFGLSLTSQPGFTWALTSGKGGVTVAGLYTAPATGTLATLTVTSGALGATASVFVLTPPVATQDIGGPVISGAAGDNSIGTYTLLGAGSNISGTSDQFRFAYTTLVGDGTLIARVATEQNTSSAAKAGVMFRNTLAANSANAFMAITPGNGAAFQARATAGGSTTALDTASHPAPYWVKLVRSGSLFSGYYSPDGVTWTLESSATITMNPTVDVGLALTSANQGLLNTATFDHVNLATAPTVVTAASATPNPDPGTSASLSALGNDLAGESNLTYTWSATSIPTGAPPPTFSANGTNAGKNDTVTLYQAGSYTFTVTLTDSAGLSTTSSVVLTVNQTVTSITVSPSSVTLPEGGTQQFSASAFDQFGQSLTTQPAFTYSVAAGGPGGTVSSTGLYMAPTTAIGTDQVQVAIGSISATATVNVTIGTLFISSFAPTSTGFTATFDEPFNLSPINLYDTATAGFGPADVTVVGANTGPVAGSLVVNPGNQAISFVKTGGVLAPDTYTVTVRSAANGFTDTSGNLLDGNADGSPGDDYVTTFTVAPSPARVIALPDFARGPGQDVVIPAATGTGLPLTISDGTDVTSISLSITYNSTLLSINGAGLGTAAPAGSSVSVDTSTPGLAVLTFTSPTALLAGPDNFATLLASVPDSAPYASKEDLVIGDMALNGGAIAAVDQDAVHAVAYLGDATGNIGLSAFDATLIRQVVANLSTGFAAYPLLDPTIVGDVAGTGSLSGLDATYIQQYVANIPQPRIPAEPNINVNQGGPDPMIWVPQDLDATPGSTLAVPILFLQTNGSTIGLDSANIALEFDPGVFTITGVTLGGVTRGFTLTDSYNNATGTLILSERSPGGAIAMAPGSRGELVWVDVTVRPGVDLGPSRINLLAVGRVGSSVLYTSLNDGYLTLTPAPSNSDLTSIDGVVTITPPTPVVNGSSQADPTITAAPAPPIGPTLVPSGPPAAVDLAIEATRGLGVLASRPASLDGLESDRAITDEPIPWTPPDPSAVPLMATDSTSTVRPKKAKDGRAPLTRAT